MADSDVIIIGGGPAGSTVATLLKKYAPGLSVTVLERETFPRDHVGESQLPLIGACLNEMGCWEKVEAAGFPIKVGATYRWGTTPDLWHFNFVPNGDLNAEARPARYEGQRTATAFQVDRAIYDQILLDHARELGAEVHEATKVAEVRREGDRVTGIRVGDEWLTARHYVDASGNSGILRRAMGVETQSPTNLRNVAVWDYWQNATWAEEIGVGGTRVQVMSLGYGWIWFIPLGPTRTSVGLIVPAEYLKTSGKRPAELYAEAIAAEPRIAALMEGATSEEKLQTTNDWSVLSDRLSGENWFLAGDTCGFADPILAAGMTLAHASGREVAYTILELERGEHDPEWLKASYDSNHRRRIGQHIRFADYWYSVNGQFKDLVAFTSEIARDAGLDLTPDKAFQWLGTGGFANDGSTASIGTFSVAAIKQLAQLMSEGDATWELSRYHELRLDLAGARQEAVTILMDGRIERATAWVRGDRKLPLTGPFRAAFSALQHEKEIPRIVAYLRSISVTIRGEHKDLPLMEALQALEAMLADGWIKGKTIKGKPVPLGLTVDPESPMLQFARD